MSVTAVPIQPIKKGSLTMLWFGIALALLLAASLVWAGMRDLPEVEVTDSGLKITTLVEGEGESPTDTDITLVNYKGMLPDGTVFDEGEQRPMPVAGVVPGFSEGLKKMQKGGSYRLTIPSELAYGSSPPPGAPIPPDTDLTFEVDLIEFLSEAEVRAMQQQQMQMQQMQQEMQGGGQPLPPGN